MGHRLIPDSRMQSHGRPPSDSARSVGHDKEWIDACRGGPPAGADFVQHAGLLTETPLLGNIAIRLQKQLQWDGHQLKFTNNDDANQYLDRIYREGWVV